MSNYTPITTHVQDALNRLLEQYKGLSVTEALIRANAEQWQDLEDAFEQLKLGRLDLSIAEGQQLDNYGTIVGQARLGLSDAEYRVLLMARIGRNISQGDVERVADVFKLLTGGTQTHCQDLVNGHVILGVNDMTLTAAELDFVREQMSEVVAAGVRIDHVVQFDPLEPFAFDGAPAPAETFGEDGVPATGGYLGKVHRTEFGFSFEDGSPLTGGFSTVADPLIGGVLQ